MKLGFFPFKSWLFSNLTIWSFCFQENLHKLLDIHVFGLCGFNKDGNFSEPGSGSPGKALLQIGQSEALVDKKHQGDSINSVVSRTSSDSILLRILANPDDVTFDKLAVDDFGVSAKL